MTTNSNRQTCQSCHSTRKVLFCTDCAQLHCGNCVEEVTINELYCNTCNKPSETESCGICGSQARIINQVEKSICPVCKKGNLGDPEQLLTSLPSKFFSILSKVNRIQPELSEIHRKFDFFVTLIRLCRLANLTGFPQIEELLKKCANGLDAITNRGIEQLKSVKKEALFNLRSMNYFQDIELDHYRNAKSILTSTKESIQKIQDVIQYWITEVDSELDKLMLLAEPMRYHYELLTEISRYLPDGIVNVVAVMPPIGINIKYKRVTRKSDAYLIFGEDSLICLPVDAITKNNKKIVNGVQYPYESINSIEETYSILKGCQLKLHSSLGEVKINSSPVIINGIKEYFDLVLSGEPYVVGSAKDIIDIENNGPDKNRFKRESGKFTDIIRQKLFGSPIQEPDPDQNLFRSMTQIKNEYTKLLGKIREIDFMAQNYQIDPQSYQNQRHQFKSNMENIQNSLGSLGGHVVQSSLDKYRFNSGSLDL